MNKHLSNQEWIDQLRRRQAVRQATRLKTLEKIMAEALKPEAEAEHHSASPLSRYRRWITTLSRWVIDHSWIAQQVQNRKGKTASAVDVGLVSELVVEAEYEVIEIKEEL